MGENIHAYFIDAPPFSQSLVQFIIQAYGSNFCGMIGCQYIGEIKKKLLLVVCTA